MGKHRQQSGHAGQHLFPDDASGILANDIILPEQFFTPRLLSTPEKRLIAAVLEDAIQVYTKHQTDGDSLQGRLYVLWIDTYHWLIDLKNDRVMSVTWCCEALGIDAVALAKKILAREPIAIFRHSRLVIPQQPLSPYRRHKKAGAR